MKKFVAILFAVMSFSVFASTWRDSKTGITWEYTVSYGKASVGSGSSWRSAVPTTTTGAITIPSTLGGYPVTSIGDGAFSGCRGLTSVTIPEGVTSIGDYAFEYCSGLTSITIPSSVTSIGYEAFAWCSTLTSVTIQEGVTSIGDQAFSGCSGLKEFIVDERNTAYKSANGLLLTKDGTELIAGVNGAVTIPSSVTGIGDGAFRGCSGLASVTIPSSVTSIGDSAFEYCSSLTSITIPNSVTSIGYDAFEYCSGLTSITIPNSVTSIGGWAFYGCSGLKEFIVDERNTAYKSANGLLLTKDGTELIAGVNGAVTIPSSVTGIGDGAFRGCSGLTSVTIPSSVTSIGVGAFVGCSSLTSVTIPSSVTSIGDSAFEYCSGLRSVTIPNSVTSIGEDTFYGCSSLASVTIPSSVTSIGDLVFFGCSGLTSVTIPNSVTSIGEGAFIGCSGLKKFIVDERNTEYKSVNGLLLTKDGTELIAGVNGAVTIPNSVTSIWGSAFRGCSSLTSVTIPSSVTSIGEGAFWGCSGLKEFIVDERNTEYKSVNGLLLTKDGTELIAGVNGVVTIPSSVTSIGEGAFFGCSGFTSVTIPNSVTSIGDDAFYGCSGLTSVTIPNSVTSIGYDAFYGCSGLATIYVYVGDTARIKGLLLYSVSSEPTDFSKVKFIEQQVYTVLFDANGGECDTISRVYEVNKTLGTLPKAIRSRYKFDGWYTAVVGGTKVSTTTKITMDVTYYAHWTCDVSATVMVSVGSDFYGMGTVSGGKTAKAGTKLTLKATATKEYVFAGWFLNDECTIQVSGDIDYRNPSYTYVVGEDDARLYAMFIPVEEDWVGVWCDAEEEYERGVEIQPIEIWVDSGSLSTIKVTGLPTGLNFTAKPLTLKATQDRAAVDIAANTIYGTPTKSGVYTVTITATSASKQIASQTFNMVIRAEGDSIVNADWDTSIGKVTGMGLCEVGKSITLKASANKGYVFAGWYDFYSGAAFEESVDYRNPTLTIKGDGEDVFLYAKFIPAEEDWVEVWCDAGEEYERGVEIQPIEIWVDSGSLSTIKVTGLPTGLNFTAKPLTLKATQDRAAVDIAANTIYGTPTKSGVYTVTITATSASKQIASQTFNMVIRAEGEAIVNAEWDASIGKVTGMGVCGVGKSITLKASTNKGYVFAGWYDFYSGAAFEGSVDYRNPTLTIKGDGEDVFLYATFIPVEEDDILQAIVDDEYYLNGEWELKLDVESNSLPTITVSGLPAGLKFDSKALIISGTPTKPGKYPVTLSLKNSAIKTPITQTFTIYVANIESPYLDVNYETDAYAYRVGSSMEFDIGSCAMDDYSITEISGLPSGLKFNKNTGMITGVPTKSGAMTATITLKNGAKTSLATITLNVNAIDTWAYGSFNGGAADNVVSLTIGSTGKISGKMITAYKTWTLSAPSYTEYDGSAFYSSILTARCGIETEYLLLEVYDFWAVIYEYVPEHGYIGNIVAEAWRNIWKDEEWNSIATQLTGRVVELTDEIKLKIGASGTVTATGKFVTGQDRRGKDIVYSSSCSTTLIPYDENCYQIYLCFPEKSGKFEGVVIIGNVYRDGDELWADDLSDAPCDLRDTPSKSQ